MNEEISKLIALQEVDFEIAGFDKQISAKRQTIFDREQAISDKESKINACKLAREEQEQRQREIKLELEEIQARIKDRQNKMMLVQTSREHQALLKEIEDNKKMLKESEEETLQVMEKVEQLTKEIAELNNLVTAEKEILADEIAKVEQEITKVNSRKEAVRTKRSELSTDLGGSLLKRYERLLVKRAGSAVVKIVDGVCQGCFMSLPPQQYNEVMKGEAIYFCPTCNRILYYQVSETEEIAERITANE